jgi:hypothetical protein
MGCAESLARPKIATIKKMKARVQMKTEPRIAPPTAMTLLIHRVEILKPQSTVVNRQLRSSILPVRGRHGGLQTHGSFGYIFEQSGS